MIINFMCTLNLTAIAVTEANKVTVAFVCGSFAKRTTTMTAKKMLHIMETPLSSNNVDTIIVQSWHCIIQV